MTAEPGQRAPSPSPLAIARREGVVEQQAMRAGLVPMVVGKFGRDALTDRLAWSEHEAAEALGVSDRTLRTWRDRGIVPYKRIGTIFPAVNKDVAIFPEKIKTGFIYTLGATKEMSKERGFDNHIMLTEMILSRIFGSCESLCSYDTYQFEDYSKVFAPRFDPEKKAQRRKEIFPLDCAKAFKMGVNLTK